MGRMPLHDLRNLEMLVHVLAQPRRPVLAADMVVVGHAREEVMRARGDVATVGPLLALQVHVALFLLLLQVAQQHRHAMARSVPESEGDAAEADAEQPTLIPRDRVLLVAPLAGGRL